MANNELASTDPDGPAEFASDGTAIAVKQADLRARLLFGEPKVYVLMCPANCYGGPRAYVERPDGDETQYVMVEELAAKAAGGNNE